MKKVITSFLDILRRRKALSIEGAVKYSVTKYHKTYELLEKYEQAGSKTPFMADDENIKGYFR